MPKGRDWTRKEENYLREHKHLSCKELGKILGRTELAIQLKKYKLRLTEPYGNLEERLKRYQELYATGLGDRNIALRMGISETSAREYRHRLGLPNRGGKVDFINKKYQIERGKRQIKYINALKKQRKKEKEGKVAKTVDIHYTESENSEFLVEVAKFVSARGRQPTLVEGFRIAKELGWTRGA